MAGPRARITLAADDRTGPAFQSLRQRLTGAQGDLNGLSRGFLGMGAAIGSIIGGAGITALVQGVANGLDKFNDLSDATGASIENLSGLEAVALRTGTSFDTVSASLIKLNQALNNSENPEVAAVLKAIGVSAKDLKALDPAEALLQTAAAFDQFAADGSRARAEQILFGRSLRDIAPFLKDLAEQGRVNATVTTAQAQAAEKFNQNLFALQESTTALGRAIFNESAPALLAISGAFKEATSDAENFNVATAGVRVVIQTLAVVGAYVADTFRGVGREIGAIAAQMAALSRLDLNGFTAISDALKEDNERAKAELDRFFNAVMNVGNKMRQAGGGRGFVNPAQVTPQSLGDFGGGRSPKKSKAAPVDPIQQLVDASTGAQFDKLIDLSAQLDARFQAGKISGTDYARALESIDKQITALGPKTKETGDALGDFIDRITESRSADLSGLIGQSTGAQYDALATRAQLLAEAFEQGSISAQDFARGAEVLGKQFDGLAPKLEQTTAFAEQAARNIQDALGDSLVSALDGKFSDIGRNFGDMLKRLVAQAAATQLANAIFGEGYGKTTTNLGGWAGSALKWLGTTFGGGKAVGGPVQPNRAYLVGERGPELMVPATAGTIVPNGALGGSSTFVVNVQGDASENTIRLIRGALAQFEAKQMMRGGAF